MPLSARSSGTPRPTLDAYGVVSFGDGWVAVTPLEEIVVGLLLDSFGTTVSREDLIAAAWPDAPRNPRALDTMIHRLRHRLAPLGLVIHTVRQRGFVLDLALPDPSARHQGS